MKRWSVFGAGIVLGCVLLGATGPAGALPYDPHADPQADIRHALVDARAEHKDVLVVFGADWCADCRVLDRTLQAPAAAALQKRFVVVKVDVGNFDRNVAFAQQYGIDLRRGIPAAALLDGSDRLIYATEAGELADARRMGQAAIVDFFLRAAGGGAAH